MRFVFVFFSALFSCAPIIEPPKLLIPPHQVGNGGKTLRQFFRSYWTPPTQDSEMLYVGLVPHEKKITFKAVEPLKIKSFSEKISWEVHSPKGVLWEVTLLKPVRPAVINYYPVVDYRLFSKNHEQMLSVEKFKKLGFPLAQWVGPPPMDEDPNLYRGERWILSLSSATHKAQATQICALAQKTLRQPCKVISRMELPPLFLCLLKAQNSNFQKEFEGFLEITSSSPGVQILTSEKNEKTTDSTYASPIFIVPSAGDNLNEGRLNLTQKTTLKTYLQTVVPSEIFSSAPLEALKAQSVVARTYVLKHLEPRSATNPYLICASTLCQMYKGHGFQNPQTNEAIEATQNLVLWSGAGDVAETFYHSSCGGHTEIKENIWGPPGRDYLKGSSDQLEQTLQYPLDSENKVQSLFLQPKENFYCGKSSFTKPERWHWEKTFDHKSIRALLKKFDLSEPLTHIEIKKRSVSGRVISLELQTPLQNKGLHNELVIRNAFGGLWSSLFLMETQKNNSGEIVHIDFKGSGFGHGVGLCQMGAIGRAQSGQSFIDILKAYYPFVNIEPLGASVIH